MAIKVRKNYALLSEETETSWIGVKYEMLTKFLSSVSIYYALREEGDLKNVDFPEYRKNVLNDAEYRDRVYEIIHSYGYAANRKTLLLAAEECGLTYKEYTLDALEPLDKNGEERRQMEREIVQLDSAPPDIDVIYYNITYSPSIF